MNEFDNKAKDWDKNQLHIWRSEAIANEMVNRIPITDDMTALEYGAGTGLLSFFLKDKFSNILLMDNSLEMIRVTESKIIKSGTRNMKTLWIDLEKEEYDGRFDVIYNQMVLHHVENIGLIFNKFYGLIKPGGYLAIADLYLEDGSFHGKGFNGHHGFDVDQLTHQLEKHAFKHIVTKPCFSLKQENERGEVREYPIFLLTANKD
ncbi:MAG: class I SAM-dependent methyltransferase [Bacteroidota bacterium]|nr:class I SAM-dependent methyltransferase [Bacteroidota bacterium]